MVDYQIDQVSDKELKFGYWLLTHKDKLKKWLIYLLAGWGVLSIGYGLYGFINHFIEEAQWSKILPSFTSQQLDFTAYRERHRPQPLEFLEPTVIYTGENKYDFVVKAKNPNKQWLARELMYQFQSGNYTSPTQTAVILPEQELYLLSLANFSPRRLNQLQLKVLDLQWQGSYLILTLPEINFVTSAVDFSGSESGGSYRAVWSATNQTIYNFREVDWQVILYSGRRIVGINQVRIEEFLSGQTREITVSWFEKLPQVSKALAWPLVKILDPTVIYQSPGQVELPY